MARIVKLAVHDTDSYPSQKVKSKIGKTLLKGAQTVFVTRKDLATVLKSGAFKKAPKTEAFLKELKASAKKNGAYHIKLSV